MKKRFISSAIFCIVISSFTCNEKKTDVIAAKPKNVLVLCDVSHSIDHTKEKDSAGRSAKMISNMIGLSRQIIRSGEPGSEFYFYVVSDNRAVSCLYYFKAEIYYDQTKRNMRHKFMEADSTIAYKIDSAYRNAEEYTCLLTSIESGYGKLRDADKSGGRTSEMIILSDMLEDCLASPLSKGYVKMKDVSTTLLPPAQMKLLESYKKEGINFDKEEIKVSIMMNSVKINSITYDNLIAAWRRLFANLGCAKAAASGNYPFIEMPRFPPNPAYESF